MNKQELAIMFSGGTDSLALFALASAGQHPELPRPRSIHLLQMLNGFSRFHDFPRQRFEAAKKILAGQRLSEGNGSLAGPDPLPEAVMVEIDSGRLFQGLWLDWYRS